MASPYNNADAAVFLDRDGVLNENHEGYVLSWEQVHLIPGSLAALTKLAQTSYVVVIVTNQSAIGRGLITPDAAKEINDRLVTRIEQYHGRIDGVYLCPHTPHDNCKCRKPKPGLLLRAARDLNIDLTRSWLIGDAITDLQAGIAVGVRALLVQSGRGATQSSLCTAHGLDHGPHLNDVAAAVDYILAH